MTAGLSNVGGRQIIFNSWQIYKVNLAIAAIHLQNTKNGNNRPICGPSVEFAIIHYRAFNIVFEFTSGVGGLCMVSWLVYPG